MREDQILPHLAALAILLANDNGGGPEPADRSEGQLTGPDITADLIGQLRAAGTILTYDPDKRTLSAGHRDAAAVVIADDRQYRAGERRTA